MTSTQFGITQSGFNPKRQQDVIDEYNQAWTDAFGSGVNLAPTSLFGQFTGVFSERFALLWEALDAVYASQYPGGAEGVAVDNILALDGLERLGARATVTDPSPAPQPNGITLYGLVLYGDPGTVIAQGSLILTATAPQQTFTLDGAVQIASPVNAVQSVLFSGTPQVGSYALSIAAPSGQTLTTSNIPYNAQVGTTLLTMPSSAGGYFRLMFGGDMTALLPGSIGASDLQAAIVALGASYAGVTVSATGTTGQFAIAWGAGAFNPLLSVNDIACTFAGTPSSGSFALVVGGTQSRTLAYNAQPSDVQAALVALGYPTVRVARFGTFNFALNFAGTPPSVSVAANTTGVTLNVASTSSLASLPVVVDSVAACINNLYDQAQGNYPFTDAAVASQGNTLSITFGGGARQSGQPSSAAKPQPLFAVAQNTLQSGSTVINVASFVAAQGAPAQGIGSATATTTGAQPVLAGQLSLIGSSNAGWTGVTNQLDCLIGADAENDTQAMLRRSSLLGSNADGPLQAIIEKVSLVPGVTNVVGFSNTNGAALQLLNFQSVPTSGTYTLLLAGGSTQPLPATADAGAIQSALASIPGYSAIQVTGSVAFGFAVDFAGSQGGQPQALIQVPQNSTGVALNISFGRPPKSFEIVVEGGANAAVAQAIYEQDPGGINAYGTPASSTTGNVTAGSSVISVASASNITVGLSVSGLGIPFGAQVAQIAGQNVTLSAVGLGTYTGTPLSFVNAATVYDQDRNPSVVTFSRPVPILFYVQVNLLTDQYRTPGVPTSGANSGSRFNPSSIARLQQEICDAGNATAIGGLVISQGTGGLHGAFNDIPGIVGYTLGFGTTPGATTDQNVQLLPTQVATFETFNVTVSYS